MLMDRLTDLSNAASLTGIAAAATGYSDVLDLSTQGDLGPSEVPCFVLFTTIPTSATAGATLNVALQTSPDNVTWTTLIETSALPIAGFSALQPFALRSMVPAGFAFYRYMRYAYTPSAALTAGAVQATVGADWPRHPYYQRNFNA